MPVYAMPIVLMIEADSLEEAQKELEDWSEEINMESDLPVGTQDMDTSPHCEENSEGQRICFLPLNELAVSEEEDENDDFSERDFEIENLR